MVPRNSCVAGGSYPSFLRQLAVRQGGKRKLSYGTSCRGCAGGRQSRQGRAKGGDDWRAWLVPLIVVPDLCLVFLVLTVERLSPFP